MGEPERLFLLHDYAAVWTGGEPVLNQELSEAHWLRPDDLAGLTTTAGLAEIVAAAFALLGSAG